MRDTPHHWRRCLAAGLVALAVACPLYAADAPAPASDTPPPSRGASPGSSLPTPAPGSAPAPTKADKISDPAPKALEGVGVTEKLNDQIPLDLLFTNEQGKDVRLADFFKPGRPVILQLGYYGCPMLCGLVMNGMTESMKGIDWTPGSEYEVLSISIDPSETPTLAREKKRNYLAELDKPGAAPGWHFLTSKPDAVKTLADAVGFEYHWDDRTQQFAHPAVLTILSPSGKVMRYLYGIKFPPKTLRLSLVEASEGKAGSTVDQIILYCFHFDPTAGKYSITAMRLMRLAGVLTVLALGSAIGIALLREHHRHPSQPPTRSA